MISIFFFNLLVLRNDKRNFLLLLLLYFRLTIINFSRLLIDVHEENIYIYFWGVIIEIL
jgi:membrane-associated phospholipid phosphatase